MQADQLASVLGLFVAAAGLAVAIFGLRAVPVGGHVRQVAKARGNSRTYQAGRDLTQRPSAQPEPGAGDGGQVRQAGRDITADDDDTER